jgi:hypothetical protein
VNFGVGHDDDVVVVVDLLHQVAGHLGAEFAVANDQIHRGRRMSEEHRSLAGGITATDDGDRVDTARLALGNGGLVVHVRGFEAIQSRHIEAPVSGAGRDEDGAGVHVVVPVERGPEVVTDIYQRAQMRGDH